MTFLLSHPAVDRRGAVGVWGMSLGGATALCAAALDPRVRFAVAVCPAVEYSQDRSKLRSVLSKAAKDRESRVKGNDAFYVPMLSRQGDNPAGFNLGTDRESALRLVHSQDLQDDLRQSLAPNHVNQTTLATYRNLLMWHPRHMWQYLDTTPVLMVVPENDHLVGKDKLVEHYESLPGPKRLHIQPGAGHMDILEGPSQTEVNELQVAFVNDLLSGRL
jgi:pimeloyl-ACP methyl ester carboxylesterase